MNFNFDVEATKDFIYKPTRLEIFIGATMEVNGVEMVAVQTLLTAQLPNGKIVEEKRHQFPKAALVGLLSGYDLMNPIINPDALTQFLRSFNLILKQPAAAETAAAPAAESTAQA